MSTLTAAEKVILRRATAKKAAEIGAPVSWVKAQIESATQAVEDILESAAFQTSVNSAIETAAPGVFTAQQKRWLAALVFELRYTRDIVG